MSFKGSHSNPFPEGGQGNENPRQGTSVQIAGYQIDCQIGRGGMATVYRAMQQSLGRQVAIKILAQSPEEDDEFAQRFKKEGRILARLLHPNIITIHDVGISENNQLFLSIEYLPGGTLGDRIKQGLSFESAIQITKAIAKALGYAHERGIIHRDVKPSNILFRQDGTPVLTDFGVARILESKTIHTLSGLAVGSPGYMSPEQAMGENATIQSDLYSLGVVLYEMLAGQRLYEASNLIAITLKHLHDPIPYLPRQYAHLQPVLNKLLAKKNTDRYRNTNEFLQELDAVTNDSTITQSVDRDISHISVMEFTTGKIQALFRKKLRRPVFILMTGFIVIIISISIFYIFGSWQKSHKENQYQLRLQAEEFFSQAQIHFQEGLLETGLYYTQQGLLAMPDHQDLLALRDQIQIRMAEEDRKRQVEEDRKRQVEEDRKRQVEEDRKRQVEEDRKRQVEEDRKRQVEEDRKRQVEEDRKRQVEEDRKRQVEEDRKRQVEEDRKRQVEASQYLARASDDRRNGKYSASLQQIERGLALVPNHEGLLQLREQVRAELEKKNKPHPKPPKPLVEPPKESNPSIEEIKKAVRELGSSLDR